MEEKYITNPNLICLFCGKESTEETEWEDGRPTNYYKECNCKDARYTRQLNKEIANLQSKLPKPKFKIIRRDVLIKNI